jgi:hypothetical protein
MLLLTHITLRCPASGAYPLVIAAPIKTAEVPTSVSQREANCLLLRRLLPRLNWAAVRAMPVVPLRGAYMLAHPLQLRQRHC